MTTPTPDPNDWTPSANQVGSLIARLLPSAGGLVTGLIDATTVPTLLQTNSIIDGIRAAAHLVLPILPAEHYEAAKRTIALGAAAQIAESFFPEAPQGYIDRLNAQYATALAELAEGVNRTVARGLEARAVQVLPIHNERPVPPGYSPVLNPYTDPAWRY